MQQRRAIITTIWSFVATAAFAASIACALAGGELQGNASAVALRGVARRAATAASRRRVRARRRRLLARGAAHLPALRARPVGR